MENGASARLVSQFGKVVIIPARRSQTSKMSKKHLILVLSTAFVTTFADPAYDQQLQTGVSQNALQGGAQTSVLDTSASKLRLDAIIARHPERAQFAYDGITGILTQRDTHISQRAVTDGFATVVRLDPNSRAVGTIFDHDLVLAVDDVAVSQRSTRDAFKREPAGTWHKYTISRNGIIMDVKFQSMPLLQAGEFFQDFYVQGQLNPAFSPYFVQDASGMQPRFGGIVDPYGNHR